MAAFSILKGVHEKTVLVAKLKEMACIAAKAREEETAHWAFSELEKTGGAGCLSTSDLVLWTQVESARCNRTGERRLLTRALATGKLQQKTEARCAFKLGMLELRAGNRATADSLFGRCRLAAPDSVWARLARRKSRPEQRVERTGTRR